MERHHLVPEHREESPVVLVCSPCHDQLHALFTNEELIEEYHTAEKLRGADRMASYLGWIRTTNKTSIDVRTSNDVRQRR
ncbi:hypothetical protein Nmn1133_05385 [Halosegnis longus]|uniref:HNH endonuclease n=2 Tax=Halosegnis longus TaxID=2216012 RepID=A0AAJ4RAZ3_9EURY|nr:hypothetical protein Nmn1133_05385 [Salella cibi]